MELVEGVAEIAGQLDRTLPVDVEDDRGIRRDVVEDDPRVDVTVVDSEDSTSSSWLTAIP